MFPTVLVIRSYLRNAPNHAALVSTPELGILFIGEDSLGRSCVFGAVKAAGRPIFITRALLVDSQMSRGTYKSGITADTRQGRGFLGEETFQSARENNCPTP